MVTRYVDHVTYYCQLGQPLVWVSYLAMDFIYNDVLYMQKGYQILYLGINVKDT